MLGLYLVTGAISLQRKLRFSVGSKLRVPREPVSLGCVKPSKAWGILQGGGVGVRSAGEEGRFFQRARVRRAGGNGE